MALIKCPECEKMISSKANSCPNCGCPIEDRYIVEKEDELKSIEYENRLIKNHNKKIQTELDKLKKSESTLSMLSFFAFLGTIIMFFINIIAAMVLLIIFIVLVSYCGDIVKKYDKLKSEIKEENQMYKRCPLCDSANVNRFVQQHRTDAKTQTRYTANLNPLKPFTIANKKEKVIKDAETISKSRFICESCGNIFD